MVVCLLASDWVNELPELTQLSTFMLIKPPSCSCMITDIIASINSAMLNMFTQNYSEIR